MAEFTVEFTSENMNCPRQETVQASSPERAIEEAIRICGIRSLIREYDKDTDPRHSYKGWSFIQISIDCNAEGVREHERDSVPGYEEDER
jgi:hypothetical protein